MERQVWATIELNWPVSSRRNVNQGKLLHPRFHLELMKALKMLPEQTMGCTMFVRFVTLLYQIATSEVMGKHWHCIAFLLTSSLFTAHLRSVTEKCRGTDIITVLTWATSFFLCHLSCLDWWAVFGIMLSLLLPTSITSFLVNTASVDFCWDRAFLFFYHESWAKELYCCSTCLRNSQVWNDLCLRNETSIRNRPLFPVVFLFP